MQQGYSFEQGPIRPPSEARSLLIRATRNCPWNKCAFFADKNMYSKVKNMIDQYGVHDQEYLDKDLLKIMNRYIQ
jgi:radical SAM superfamily enzyme YgiQ (UPF0313 family)